MDAERWQRVNELFQAAIERSSAERPAFLASACGDDDELRRVVERLVGAHDRAGSFLDDPADLNARQLVASGGGLAAHQPTLPSYQAGPEFSGTERFEILRQLGSGGMGVVYAVCDRTRNEVVALKTLHRASPAAIYRLKREFRSLAEIAHPNLACLYELIVDETNCFFTMELVNGVHFVDYVNGDAPLDGRTRAERVRNALGQILDGLAELHSHGKLHRDIKPSNILVTATGRVVILDFGLTSDVVGEDVAADEWMAGTPAYFAPERYSGVAPSESQDSYSLGVTLFEALTGRRPFDGPLAETVRWQRELDPPAPRDVSADVPADLNAICLGLLRPDPARRFTAREVRQQLRGDSATSTEALRASDDGHTTFVGRREQLDALADAWSATKQRRATAVHVHGPSGIGKSALIDAFLKEALKDQRTVVLRGRCHEHESVPYKAFDGVIDSLSQYLSCLPRSEAKRLMPADTSAMCRLFPVMLRLDPTPLPQEWTHIDPVLMRQKGFAALREFVDPARVAGAGHRLHR